MYRYLFISRAATAFLRTVPRKSTCANRVTDSGVVPHPLSCWRRCCLLAASRLLFVSIAAGQHESPSTTSGSTRPSPERTSPAWSYDHEGIAGGPPIVIRQINVDAAGQNIVGDAANEPSLAVDPADPQRIVVGWRQFNTIVSNFREAGRAYSRDAGRTWTNPGVLDAGVFRSDPVLRSTPDGRVIYYSLTILNDLYVCDIFYSDDNGASFTGPLYAFGGDKAWIAIDHTNSPGRGNFYAAWDYAGCCTLDRFNRSFDRGETVDPPVPMLDSPNWGTMTIDAQGAVYVCGWPQRQRSGMVVIKSSNAQDPTVTPTWDFSRDVEIGGSIQFNQSGTPNPGGLMGQAWIVADTSDAPTGGNLYLLCSVDPPGPRVTDLRFTRSLDGGLTWAPSIEVAGEPGGSNQYQWFGTLGVAPNGRIDVVWYDTRAANQVRFSDVRYRYSTDGGLTFSTPIVIAPMFDSLIGWPNQNKLGDYIDIHSDRVGFYLAFAATYNGEQDVYLARVGEYDCNDNGIGDATEITSGAARDRNGNGIPDRCDGLGDLNCSGLANNFDIDPFVLALTDAQAYAATYPHCDRNRADINGDGVVNNFDIDLFVELLTDS